MSRRWKRTLSFLIFLFLCVAAIGGYTTNPLVKNAKAEKKHIDGDWFDDEIPDDETITDIYFPADYIGYQYPVLPGTSSWPYGNHQDMVDVCQIPKEIVENMSTLELLESVLIYPLLGDVDAYDDRTYGFERIKNSFYGLEELLKRSDFTDCLLYWLIAHREYFLSQPGTGNAFFDYYYNNSKMNFMRLALMEEAGLVVDGVYESALSTLNAILSNEETDLENTRDYTLVSFQSYYADQVDSTTSVTTPRYGPMSANILSAWEVWLCSDNVLRPFHFSDLTADAKSSMATYFYTQYGLYPDSGRPATVKYNCHSYAWYSTAATNTYWIDTFNTLNYTEVSIQSVNVGGIAVFCESYAGNITPQTVRKHSAIVLGKIYHPVQTGIVIDLSLRSKWGRGGLYTHQFANCPYYYYDSTNYVSDRLYYN